MRIQDIWVCSQLLQSSYQPKSCTGYPRASLNRSRQTKVHLAALFFTLEYTMTKDFYLCLFGIRSKIIFALQLAKYCMNESDSKPIMKEEEK